jgi:hypothetical protein
MMIDRITINANTLNRMNLSEYAVFITTMVGYYYGIEPPIEHSYLLFYVYIHVVHYLYF